ncbi:copper chaperone PCu(A)C [Cognatiluteimonas profundi]|uniref:copper chaperone PCu(A)C n=1 Tax=Cognatiluteimonas profundi TaxID=2594501 RepID=UPI00131D3274|nr:copper chaperone PCu(A)C [Lysobacter profundi]
MHSNRTKAAIAACLYLCVGMAWAAPPCTPVVRDGWIRLMPGGMAMLAGFGHIDNPCGNAADIVSASSRAFADTSIHETRIEDGISRMRPVPDLHIEPKASAVLAPGGYHLMLMQPTATLKAGDRVTIDFSLRDGRSLSGTFELRPAAP